MQITISGDHRGHDAVESVVGHLKTQGHDVVVQGACDGAACGGRYGECGGKYL